jgi:hypothetical protein
MKDQFQKKLNATGLKVMRAILVPLILLLTGSRIPAGQVPESGSKPDRLIGEVSAIELSIGQLLLKTDTGESVVVKVSPQTSCLLVAPGETTLDKADRISLQVIGIGDRVFVIGQVAEDRKAMSARQLIVMARAELAEQRERDRADWRRRGITGTIAAVNPNTKEITLLTSSPAGDKTITVMGYEAVRYRRYAPGSIKFSDAKPGSFAELRVGDQLRARGEKSNDGLRFKPEEIVSGTFRSIGGTIISINAETREIKVQEIQAQQPVAVAIAQDLLVRRLPEDMVRRITRRMRAGGARPGASEKRPANVADEPDWQETIEQLPALAVADLKPGDRVIITSTGGAQPERVTAIGLFTGVDALLKLLQERQSAQHGSGGNQDLGLPGGVLGGIGRP